MILLLHDPGLWFIQPNYQRQLRFVTFLPYSWVHNSAKVPLDVVAGPSKLKAGNHHGQDDLYTQKLSCR